jgi:hypothetical protein
VGPASAYPIYKTRFRRTDHAELSGSKGCDRSMQKAAAIMVDFFGHSSLSN